MKNGKNVYEYDDDDVYGKIDVRNEHGYESLHG